MQPLTNERFDLPSDARNFPQAAVEVPSMVTSSVRLRLGNYMGKLPTSSNSIGSLARKPPGPLMPMRSPQIQTAHSLKFDLN